jgi:hypothetical protein
MGCTTSADEKRAQEVNKMRMTIKLFEISKKANCDFYSFVNFFSTAEGLTNS